MGDDVEAELRLTDRIGLGVLNQLVTRELVLDVLRETGRQEQRNRLLPARAVVYFVLALSLFSRDPYEEVMQKLVQGLKVMRIWKGDWRVPTTAALSKARIRLGIDPLREIFERVAIPCAMQSTVGASSRGHRLMAIDGVEFDIPDTPPNAEHFGYSGVKKNEKSAFPKIPMMALVECGTHAIVAVETGTQADSEWSLARRLAAQAGVFEPGMLVMCDRGLYGYDLISELLDIGVDVCFRVSAKAVLPMLGWLPDGSYRSYIVDRRVKGNHQRRLDRGALKITDLPGIHVRVVEYEIPNRIGKGEIFTLVTSILDHEDMEAIDLAGAYRERWEAELAFDELKTHERGTAMVMRSKSPEMIIQELYGFLIIHYAVRRLMTQAADQADLDPDRLSFTRSLNIIRRQVVSQAGFSPSDS